MSKRIRALARKVVLYGIMITITLIVAGLLGELALRVLPIPGITFHTFYYDDLVGYVYYPGTTNLYRNERGDVARRQINQLGYMDNPVTIPKAAGVTRIGFFGDSYTVAEQVPIESTWHKVVEAELNRRGNGRFECVAIAANGRGTLQSWLEYERWADSLEIDHAVYVFCENDPGNNIESINAYDNMPYPLLSGDSLVVDMSFRERYRRKTAPKHRAWQFVKSRSLLVSALESRLRLLFRYGVETRVVEAERGMMVGATDGALRPGAPVSMWPDSLIATATQLMERQLYAWARMAEADGRSFAVAYVPKERFIGTPFDDHDAWGPWLRDACARMDIAFLNPAARFHEAQQQGIDVYFDHFTVDGNARFAEVIVAWCDSLALGR